MEIEVTGEAVRHKQMIIDACRAFDITPKDDEWEIDPDDGRLVARLGRWQVLDDDEDRGLYEGDEGVLSAHIVGAQEFDNEQVKFYFLNDDFDGGGEPVTPFDDVEPE